jgi:hypothetical protein
MATKVIKKVEKIEKKVDPKVSAAAVKKEKVPVVPKEPKEKKVRFTPNSLCRQLLMERTYTDDEITVKVREVFPEAKFNPSYVSTTRIDLNKGFYKTVVMETPVIKIVEFEGKKMSIDEYRTARQGSIESTKAAKEKEKAEKQAAKAKADQAKVAVRKAAADEKQKVADQAKKEAAEAKAKLDAEKKAEKKASPASTGDGMYSGPVVGKVPQTAKKIVKAVKK